VVAAGVLRTVPEVVTIRSSPWGPGIVVRAVKPVPVQEFAFVEPQVRSVGCPRRTEDGFAESVAVGVG
jgi:hypothetical protein